MFGLEDVLGNYIPPWTGVGVFSGWCISVLKNQFVDALKSGAVSVVMVIIANILFICIKFEERFYCAW